MDKKQANNNMNIRPRKEKNQYSPFVIGSDRAQPFIAYREDPSVGDISWKQLAAGIKRNRGQDSMVLTILVGEYQRKAKTADIDAALEYFWTFQEKLSPKILNKDMRLFLVKAYGGDTKATHVIVRSCPNAIHLPFIATSMANMVTKYKNTVAGKLREIRDTWDDFLPKRSGGLLPYADEDLTRLVKKAKQQDDRPTSGGRKHITSLYDDIAGEMGIGTDILKKKVKIKAGPGRPRKGN